MRLALLMALVLVATVSCGGDDGGESISGDDVTVNMFDNRYEYTEITVPVGGSVTFVGAGRNPHNAVSADESWSTADVFGSLEQPAQQGIATQQAQVLQVPLGCVELALRKLIHELMQSLLDCHDHWSLSATIRFLAHEQR